MNIDFNNIPKFDTIKSKVTIILTAISIIYFAVVLVFCYAYYNESKRLIVESYNHFVSETAKTLNKGMNAVEHTASDLAVAGKSYYDHSIKKDVIIRYIKGNLIHYKEPIGEGLWFEPYAVNSSKKFDATYGTRDDKGEIVFYDVYNTEEYDYFHKEWYRRVADNVTPENNMIWGLSHGDYTTSKLLITAGVGIFDKGKLVGISEVDMDFNDCLNIMKSIKPTPGSFTLFADKETDYVFLLTDPYVNSVDIVGKHLSDIPWYSEDLKNGVAIGYHGFQYVPFIKILDNGMLLIVNIPKIEMLGSLYIKVLMLLLAMTSLSAIMIILLYRSLNGDILQPINKLITIANKIIHGETDTHIKIENPAEFALLASTYDKMTENIKQITEKQTKMNYELSIANSIQISSLPSIFPPFPEHKEFSIFASMTPAKEVGGDFYDFFFKDNKHLMFLVADVSGKGVPAALFMMTVKTLINNISPTISSPEKLVEVINQKLHATNKEGLFVTMFACIVNIHTGEMTCLNCGHNPPLLRRNNGKYEYLNIDPNMVLGIFDKVDLKIYNTTLNTGDAIFLYTDGITEAINPENEIYGEERLEECMNNIGVAPVEEVVQKVRENVKAFTRGHSQSDDATMLMFQYNKTLRKFEKPALKEHYKDFKEWLHTTCKEWELNEDISNKLDMCGEELFANICFYAYPNETGDLSVTLEKNDKLLTMVWEDSGIIYNPLQKPDPDLDIPPKERKLGGLGIFMVKQMADDIKYQRTNNQNILTLEFNI